MLDIVEDEPTVRNAIQKRLDGEPGVTIVELITKEHKATKSAPRFLRVGVLVQLDNGKLLARSLFDLPESFEHMHLVNEIDQMCEQFKAARRDFWGKGGRLGMSQDAQRTMLGTGMRGLWPDKAPEPKLILPPVKP